MKGLMKGKLRINIRAKILGTLRCRLSVKRQGRRRTTKKKNNLIIFRPILITQKPNLFGETNTQT